MYKITKIINNNIVSSVDSKGNEVILRGLGIGFKQCIGSIVDDNKIEKVYTVKVSEGKKIDPKLKQIVDEIPLEYVEVCNEIVQYAESILGNVLNKSITLTLADHIDFAIERCKADIRYNNGLLYEIINFYPTEFNIGKKAVEIINERFEQALNDDEAGFIAMHIVNAELNTDMNNVFDITEMIKAVAKIVEKHYNNLQIDIYSASYTRFITHMKFFGQRLFKNQLMKDDDEDFQRIIREKYNSAYACACKINSFISAKYNKVISEEELILIAIHLRHISKSC